MADHGARWAEAQVNLTDAIMVLVVGGEYGSMPTWARVNLADWVAPVRPRPLIAKSQRVSLSHDQLKNQYKYAYQGSCKYAGRRLEELSELTVHYSNERDMTLPTLSRLLTHRLKE